MTLARGLTILTLLFCTSVQADAPRRVISMNLCADQMVLLLAEPGTVASVSFLTADSQESPVAHLVGDAVLNHGQAEEIIALEPDLVVAGRYTTSAAKVLLRRLGYEVVEVDLPPSLDGVREAFLSLGEVLGRQQRARDIIGEIDQRFSQLDRRVAGHSFGSVLILDANGFTVGRPSLIDQMLSRIGLYNVAADLGVGDFGQLSLEAVILAQPKYIVRLSYRPNSPSLANQTLSHPALMKFLGDQRMISIPQSWVSCGGPYLVDAASHVLDAVNAQQVRFEP